MTDRVSADRISEPVFAGLLMEHSQNGKFSVLGVSGRALCAMGCAFALYSQDCKLGSAWDLSWLSNAQDFENMRKPIAQLMKFFKTCPKVGNFVALQALAPLIQNIPDLGI